MSEICKKLLAEIRRCEHDEPNEFFYLIVPLADNPQSYEAIYDGFRNKTTFLLRCCSRYDEIIKWKYAMIWFVSYVNYCFAQKNHSSLLCERLKSLIDFCSDALDMSIWNFRVMTTQDLTSA